MVRLSGRVSIADLPPHRGIVLNLCLFKVSGTNAKPPFGSDPPAEAVTDCHKVAESLHINEESKQPSFEQTFAIKHSPGYYYLQVRALLFREREGSLFCQAEQFFFSKKPVWIFHEAEEETVLSIAWPKRALEELHYYGTMTPKA
jgi:hypothetical protein